MLDGSHRTNLATLDGSRWTNPATLDGSSWTNPAMLDGSHRTNLAIPPWRLPLGKVRLMEPTAFTAASVIVISANAL